MKTLFITGFHYFFGVDVYTDGSHKDQWGSWSYVIVRRGKMVREAFGCQKKANSQRMEFQAAIEATSSLNKSVYIRLYSDSIVLVNAATNQKKRPHSNRDQIEILDQLSLKHKISWFWVKAHSGHIFNERADKLCEQARKLKFNSI